MALSEKGYSIASNPQPELCADPLVLFAGESHTLSGHTVGPKVLDYYLLHRIISGKGVFVCSGQEFTLQAGDSFLIHPGQLVAYSADQEEPWHYRWIAFQGKSVPKLLQNIGFTLEHPVAVGMKERDLERPFQQIQTAFHDKKPYAPMEAAGYLYLLFSMYGERQQAAQSHVSVKSRTQAANIVRQALQYFTTHYAEEITMETLADSLGYNRAYVSRMFKKHTGMTPISFLLKLRVDQARRLLRDRPDLTVEQIALSVGFHDPLYFSKQFRRLHGESPTQYRQAFG